MPPKKLTILSNAAQTANGVGLLWAPILSIDDGMIAIHDLGPLIPPPDASLHLSFTSISYMLKAFAAADIQITSVSNPHISARIWHALMILNQVRTAMGQFLRLSNPDAVSSDLPNNRKKLFDLIESKWNDITSWLDYLSTICLTSSTRTHLNLDQRHLIFTVILEFVQTCFYSDNDPPHMARHNIHSLVLDACLPITARLWYKKAVRSSFRDFMDPTAAALFAGIQQVVFVRQKKFDWVVARICDWVHISREQIAMASLAELQQRFPDPYSRLSHLSYNTVLIEFFASTDSTFSRHLISHSSLRIVIRVLYHGRSAMKHAYTRTEGDEAHMLMVTTTTSILKYLTRHMEGTDGVSGIVLSLRAGLLPAMLGSFSWLDVPGRVDVDSMESLLSDFCIILRMIQKHMIYLSVLREVKREVDKMAKGFSRGHFGGVKHYTAWVEFEARLENLLAVAGTDISKRCDNSKCRRRDVRCKFPYCSGCREGCFCGRECQIKVWKDHQQRCKDIQSRRLEGKLIAPSQIDLDFAEKVILCEIRKNNNRDFGVCRTADYTRVPPTMLMVKKASVCDIIVTIPNGISLINLTIKYD